MEIKFSLVYPTRHRPEFIQMALKFLESQNYDNYEVIVCDNYTDPSLSCKKHCDDSLIIKNIKYVRPPEPIGMVENWNYALQFATGDYVCYFTDKMFLIPNTLKFIDEILSKNRVDIVSWVDNKYTPEKFPDYFGEGLYFVQSPDISIDNDYEIFESWRELQRKTDASVSRSEQSASVYARGKICFGAYSKELISRIISKADKLFHNISPDYTSMILGLSLSKNLLEINRAGIVHINTDLSNGSLSNSSDKMALAFLQSLDNYPDFMRDMLIPGLYSSQHNVVCHDYISLRRKYNLSYDINYTNWLLLIRDDLDLEGRQWSDNEVGNSQQKLFLDYIQSLDRLSYKSYSKKLAAVIGKRKKIERINNRKLRIDDIRKRTNTLSRNFVKAILPNFILLQYRKNKRNIDPSSSEQTIKVNYTKLTDIKMLFHLKDSSPLP